MKFDTATLEDGVLRLDKTTGEGSGYVLIVEDACMVELWSIPMYGGEERFEGHFDTMEQAVTEARSWT